MRQPRIDAKRARVHTLQGWCSALRAHDKCICILPGIMDTLPFTAMTQCYNWAQNWSECKISAIVSRKCLASIMFAKEFRLYEMEDDKKIGSRLNLTIIRHGQLVLNLKIRPTNAKASTLFSFHLTDLNNIEIDTTWVLNDTNNTFSFP